MIAIGTAVYLLSRKTYRQKDKKKKKKPVPKSANFRIGPNPLVFVVGSSDRGAPVNPSPPPYDFVVPGLFDDRNENNFSKKKKKNLLYRSPAYVSETRV